MSELDDLRVGEKVAEGSFRIDQKRALEKLRTSRLANPAHWVLEVLRAAHASGAKQVHVRIDADDVEVRWDGRGVPATVMKNLLGHALGSDDEGAEPRHRLLALGVAGALGVGLKRLVVGSGTARVTIDAKGEVTVDEAKVEGTFIAARRRFGAVVATTWLSGKSPEATAIREHVRCYGPYLTLNGEPLQASEAGKAKHDVNGIRIWAEPALHEGQSVVRVDVFGVKVAVRHVDLPGLPLNAVVQCDAMRRDASGGNIVDDDPKLKAALAACERLSLEALAEAVELPELELRRWAARRLMGDENLSARARVLLEGATLFPGPSGERHSVAQLKAHVATGRPLYTADRAYPKGTYPEPTVLLDHETAEYDALLPGAKREDVGAAVRKLERATENKARWAAQPEEPATLPDRDWLATAVSDTPRLLCNVGIEAKGSGAFVRLLANGRFLQQGEVPHLAPLRLRAVVDYRGTLNDKTWAEIPNPKLWSEIVDTITDTAVQAIEKAVAVSEPSFETRAHAVDVMVRANGKALPDALVAAPLFECVGGGRVSLRELAKETRWRFVNRRFAHPLLDGNRVLSISDAERRALEPYASRTLVDVSEQLDRELHIRRRLNAAKREPKLQQTVFLRMPIVEADLHGELGILDFTERPQLDLYREGFHLEATRFTARYGPVAAAIEYPKLTPATDWSKAVRDAGFDRVLSAVKDAERRLATVVLSEHRDYADMPVAVQRWLTAFALKELKGNDAPDPLARSVLDAKLLSGPEGRISLGELQQRATHDEGRVWLVPETAARDFPNTNPERTLATLEGCAAVAGYTEERALIEAATGIEPGNGLAEIDRVLVRRRFLERPVWQSQVADAPLHVAFEHAGYACEAGLATRPLPEARVTVLLEQREWHTETLPASLPIAIEVAVKGADPAAPLGEALREALTSLIQVAVARIVESALDTNHVGALHLALKGLVAVDLPPTVAKRLLDAKLFPCTDAVSRSARELDAVGTVHFITEPLKNLGHTRTWFVLATDPKVRQGLERFDRADVTKELRVEVRTRAARLLEPEVKEVRFNSFALLKRTLAGRVEGELALVSDSDGRLELLFERRPLCTLLGVLPPGLAATVNCDALKPTPGYDGVVRNAEYEALVTVVKDEASLLGEDFASWWDTMKPSPELRTAALRLSAQLATRKKKGKRVHPLLLVPLLTTTEGLPLSVHELLESGKKQRVRWSSRAGPPLEGGPVWHADAAMRERLKPLKLDLKDVTAEVERAAQLRARAKVEKVAVALQSEWRERIEGDGLEGEVVLPPLPSGQLVVELYRERIRLERFETGHSSGAHAAVNCDALATNPSWTKAARGPTFRTVMSRVEAALHRLVARRVMAGDAGARAWAEAAVLTGDTGAGPLATVLPTLLLFESLAGARVSVGAVLAEFDKARRVAVASGELEAPADRLVLADSTRARELLAALGVTVKDVSDELKRAGELEAARLERRLGSLAWPGDALARLAVKANGISGELAVPAGEAPVSVTLAKQGVRVRDVPEGLAEGLAGVVDVDALVVNASWTEAALSAEQRGVIAQHVEQLKAELARATLPEGQRPAARRHVLAWLHEAGVRNPAHLDRLGGAAAALARMAVFETVEGEWVGLETLADEVRRRGKVAAFGRSLFRPDTGDALGLKASALNEPWLAGLEGLLGNSSVERVKNPKEWRELQQEEDPPKGSPERWALLRLRREVRLLRVGALGELSPEDVEDVRLRGLGGASVVRYDEKRRVVLLDADHPLVKRALAEGKVRRERLYVLLAAIYGAINRALDRITDAHEEQLSMALAAHLAANPKLLDGADE